MRRLHLLEIEDQPWCPRAIRDGATDYLRLAMRLGRAYESVAARLREAVERAGAPRIVDLCSGGGGPWPRLIDVLDRHGDPVDVVLTDRYPNREALREVQRLAKGRVAFCAEPVDASRIPSELEGFRTLFTSFHHFRPAEAQAILRDAVSTRQGIGVFEIQQRSLRSLLMIPPNFLMVLLVTPFLRPFRWSRLLWTYVLPAIPTMVVWDGIVSCLRTYTPAELREMTDGFGDAGYVWEIGQQRGGVGPAPITYLVGRPA